MAAADQGLKNVCRVLSLDGGGAKGFYTLGVLKQVEALLGGGPLCAQFDLIFGTSTGAIIAALLGLGRQVDEVRQLYESYVPKLMSRKLRSTRTRNLEFLAHEVFGDAKFDAMKTHVGIVTARWREERPMIFKTNVALAHGSQATFAPGFGCTIADAVVASASAYPFFDRKVVRTEQGHDVELFDGGYCANNPTLYAITDATVPLAFSKQDLRVVSIGVGNYPPPRGVIKRAVSRFWLVELLQKTLDVNTHSMETLASLLFKDVPMVRINDSYTTPDMATDLMEHNLRKLRILHSRGFDSFGKHEKELKALLGVG